ncbi:hypothetical protein AB1Y20_014574 [Prymnesium parvum]|uniref:Uncharacterized protein n=1 Tax=Prymnesium parvum TaxID=97485 RepID=A0AB34ICF1_PRYPA
MLFALQMPVAYSWAASQLHFLTARPVQRSHPFLLEVDPLDASKCGAATGGDVPKTDGIPNYMFRTSGTVTRLAEGADSSAAVHDDGVVYEADRVISLLTSDVIEMFQQQGGTAENIDYIGENMLVEGMLFDDFKAEDLFGITPPDSADGDADAVSLKIIEPRPSSALELGQLGDDEGKRQSILSLSALAPGFSGWNARVVVAGRVRAGFKIAKRNIPAPDSK